MKSLHLPVNISSQLLNTVKALNCEGLQSKGLILGDNIMHSNIGISRIPKHEIESGWLSYIKSVYNRTRVILDGISSHDIIHYHYGTTTLKYNFDILFCNLMDKVKVVEFWGTDIIRPSIGLDLNPLFGRLLVSEYKNKINEDNSVNKQKLFANNGFSVVVSCPSLIPHIIGNSFDNIFFVRQRLNLSEFIYSPPSRLNSKRSVKIYHSPTAPIAKGSAVVVKAISSLKSHYDIEFLYPHKRISHSDNLKLMQNCDISLDQFIYGSYGISAIEAMAMGKVVFCYIADSVIGTLPEDLPIINASPTDLEEKLEYYIENRDLLYGIGRKSRSFAKKYHDSSMNIKHLVEVYQYLKGVSHNIESYKGLKI